MDYIYVHGLGQKPSSWNKVISCFSENMQGTCLDLTTMNKGEDVNYAALYSAFEDYCSTGSEPLNICGISLGAVLALNYAIEHPLKVKSLILAAPQYKMPRKMLKLQNIAFRFMPRKSFQKIGFNKKSIINLTASMINLDFSEGVRDINCSTLIVCGERDRPNIKAAKDLANYIPSAAFCIIKDAAHEINVDAPELLAASIKDFWGNCR